MKNDGKMKWYMVLGAGSTKHPCSVKFVKWSRLSGSVYLQIYFLWTFGTRLFAVHCISVSLFFTLSHEYLKLESRLNCSGMVTEPETSGIIFWSHQCSTRVYQGLVLLPTCVPKKRAYIKKAKIKNIPIRKKKAPINGIHHPKSPKAKIKWRKLGSCVNW